MKVAIFGATGKTGLPTVAEALAAGHHVTAFVRTPSKMTQQHENLTVVQGDILDPSTIPPALAGHDAAIVILSSGDLSKSTVRSQGTANVIAAMQAANAQRLIVVSSIGVGDSTKQLSRAAKLIMKTLLKNAIADHALQESHVQQSGLNWTIVRPSGLTDDPKSGKYSLGQDKHFKASRIARADVAVFLVKQLEDSTYTQQAVSIS